MKLDESLILKCLMSWRNRISAAVWLIVKDTHAAEDIFQNVALKAITRKVEFQAEAALVSWAFVTARREGIDWTRRHGRISTCLDSELMELMEHEWVNQSGSPASGRQVDALSSCLESLPEKSRSLLKMRYYEGYDCGEVAEKVGIELNAVYKRLSRIHLGLKQCIEKRMEKLNPA